jgi:hypothetical protein
MMGVATPISRGDLVIHARMGAPGVVLAMKGQTLPIYKIHWVTDTGWKNQAPRYVVRDEIVPAAEFGTKEHECSNRGLCGRCLQLGGDCRKEQNEES